MTADEFTVHESDGTMDSSREVLASQWSERFKGQLDRKRKVGEVWCLVDKRYV
jgi:hypothetical protein